MRKENPESKEHHRRKKMQEEPAQNSSFDPTDIMIQSYIAIETARGQSDLWAQKVAEMNSYVQAFINPRANISAVTKARVKVLLATIRLQLQLHPVQQLLVRFPGPFRGRTSAKFFQYLSRLPLLQKTLHFPAVLLQLPEVTRSKTC